MDTHLVLIFLKDVVVNVLKVFFDHQLEDKFVELNKINLFEMLNQEHRDLLDHNEMLFIQTNLLRLFIQIILFYLLIQMHRLYDL
jgi:hypothetical protein